MSNRKLFQSIPLDASMMAYLTQRELGRYKITRTSERYDPALKRQPRTLRPQEIASRMKLITATNDLSKAPPEV